MSRSVLLAACLALTLSIGAVEPPKPGEKWVALEAAGFRFISGVSPGETRQIARDLLRMHAALGMVSDVDRHAAEPTSVFVFPTTARFAVYCRMRRPKCENVTGLFIGNGNGSGNFILLSGDAKGGVDRVVYHELTHYWMASTTSHLPLWFHEGLAEYFSTFRTAAAETHLGVPVEDHVRWLGNERLGPLRKRLMPLRELFATTSSSPIYNEGKRAGVFYAQSWALVHYLMHDDVRREKLSHFLDLLGSGKPVDAAFDEAFQMPVRDLEEALHTYIRRATFTVYAYPLGDVDIGALPEPAAMPYDAVLHQFGRLVAHARPENAADAERLFKEALAANARNAGAHADLGRLYDTTGRRTEADAAYAKVAQLGGNDLEPYLVAGRGILHRDASEFAKARPLFQRATELDPNSAAAWAGLGATYLLEPVDRASGIAALEKSLDLDPDDEEAAFYLAQLWSADGRNHRTVRKLAESLLARSANPALKAPLTNMLAVASINEAVEKANAGHYVEALMLVDAALPAIQDEEARRQARLVRDMIAAEAGKRR